MLLLRILKVSSTGIKFYQTQLSLGKNQTEEKQGKELFFLRLNKKQSELKERRRGKILEDDI